MLSLADRYRFEGRAEGREEGIAEGVVKGIAEGVVKGVAEGIEKGMSIGANKLAELIKSGVSVDEALRLLALQGEENNGV